MGDGIVMRTFTISLKVTDAEWEALEDFAVCNMVWVKDNKPLEYAKSRRALDRLWHKINKEIYRTEEYKEAVK